jgi:hypothetical protein
MHVQGMDPIVPNMIGAGTGCGTPARPIRPAPGLPVSFL